MNTLIMPLINLTLHQAQRCHQLAWFLYGCLEREQMLNLNAFAAWWVREAALTPSQSRSSPRDGLDADAAASATKTSARSTKPLDAREPDPTAASEAPE